MKLKILTPSGIKELDFSKIPTWIRSISSSLTSSNDGTNSFTFYNFDNTSNTYSIKNGQKGSTGDTGSTGSNGLNVTSVSHTTNNGSGDHLIQRFTTYLSNGSSAGSDYVYNGYKGSTGDKGSTGSGPSYAIYNNPSTYTNGTLNNYLEYVDYTAGLTYIECTFTPNAAGTRKYFLRPASYSYLATNSCHTSFVGSNSHTDNNSGEVYWYEDGTSPASKYLVYSVTSTERRGFAMVLPHT